MSTLFDVHGWDEDADFESFEKFRKAAKTDKRRNALQKKYNEAQEEFDTLPRIAPVKTTELLTARDARNMRREEAQQPLVL